MAIAHDLVGKEKAYSDYYNKRISEDELFLQIEKIDNERGAPNISLKKLLLDFLVPSLHSKTDKIL